MKNSVFRFGPLSPQALFTAFWAAGVLLPLLPFLYGLDGFTAYWAYEFRDKSAAVATALTIYLAVLASALLGMIFGATGAHVEVPPRPPRGLSFGVRALVITSLGCASVLATIVLVGGVGNWLAAGSDRIRQFAGFNFIVILQNALLSVSIAWFIKIARAGMFRRRPPIAFIAYSLAALGIVSLQGAKSILFVYLLAILVVWQVRVRRLPFLRLATLGVLTFVGLMVYHVVKQELLVVGEFVFYDAAEGFLRSFGRMLFLQLTGNLMQLQCMAVLVDAMPEELSFQYGDTLKMVVLIWVPSLLFPDKPLTAPGVFTMALWPEALVANGTTMPPGLFGELYMNFGWPGAVVGALVFGVVYGRVYGRAVRSRRDLPLGTYALLAGMMLHYFRGELAAVTVLFVSMLVPLVWLLRGPTRQEISGPGTARTGEH